MYLYKSEDSLKIYEFKSEGPKGVIHKMVEYSETGTKNIYNLAFGDFNETQWDPIRAKPSSTFCAPMPPDCGGIGTGFTHPEGSLKALQAHTCIHW